MSAKSIPGMNVDKLKPLSLWMFCRRRSSRVQVVRIDGANVHFERVGHPGKRELDARKFLTIYRPVEN